VTILWWINTKVPCTMGGEPIAYVQARPLCSFSETLSFPKVPTWLLQAHVRRTLFLRSLDVIGVCEATQLVFCHRGTIN